MAISYVTSVLESVVRYHEHWRLISTSEVGVEALPQTMGLKVLSITSKLTDSTGTDVKQIIVYYRNYPTLK